jgi:hypothetical protein
VNRRRLRPSCISRVIRSLYRPNLPRKAVGLGKINNTMTRLGAWQWYKAILDKISF